MEQLGGVCAVDENIDNLSRVQRAPVRHSAADVSGESTQSIRHSAVRGRRRQAQESETPNAVALSRSESRSVGNLSSRHRNDLSSCNGTVRPRVDTRQQTAHLNSCAERCQDPAIVVQNGVDGDSTWDVNVTSTLLPESDRDSDGRTRNVSYRTPRPMPSDGDECISNAAHDETYRLTAANSVAALEQSRWNGDGNNVARNNRAPRTGSAIECRTPPSDANSSINGTAVNGIPVSIDAGTSAGSDARNDKRIVPRSGSVGALAKVGDFDREREIERRMRELGLWECKLAQERRLADMLDSQISRRDGLTAALGRCRRRRQRGQTTAAAIADDIRAHVNQRFTR